MIVFSSQFRSKFARNHNIAIRLIMAESYLNLSSCLNLGLKTHKGVELEVG